jgi:flagellin-specific chaperone FliS
MTVENQPLEPNEEVIKLDEPEKEKLNLENAPESEEAEKEEILDPELELTAEQLPPPAVETEPVQEIPAVTIPLEILHAVLPPDPETLSTEAFATENQEVVSQEVAPETSVPVMENTTPAIEVPVQPEKIASPETPVQPEKEPAEEVPDFSGLDKAALLESAEKWLKENDIKRIEPVLKPLRTAFDELKEQERQAALEKFISEGGAADDFELKADEITQKFERTYRQLRDRKNQFFQEQEKRKEQNLKRKQELLEELRQMVDGEENQESFQKFKTLQQAWKSIGVLPAGASKDLWASYEILVDRYHNKMSIYRELKELDRKKNIAVKQEVVERAEKLALQEEVTGQTMKELNDLHEEYKHIGPAPKEEQEALWQRFKAASDQIYEKRRLQQDKMKGEWDENYQKKVAICEVLEVYTTFITDKIGEWNEKTREVMALQKQWDASGATSREKAKEISKRFWAAFKLFFHNKSEFFRKLEEQRESNLKEKTQLCEEAEALRESDEFERTADRMKVLQQRWKEIGPVPEKVRETIFERFKTACDAFFERKRSKVKDTEGSYENNLKRKEEICGQLEKMAEEKSGTLADLKKLQSDFNAIGFVPRKDMESIRKRYTDASERAYEALSAGSTKEEKVKHKQETEKHLKQNDLPAERIQNKNEGFLRKKLTQLENDVAVWENNMAFFGRSKNADTVLKEFTTKIESAQQEIISLRKQLQEM